MNDKELRNKAGYLTKLIGVLEKHGGDNPAIFGVNLGQYYC